VWLNQLQVKNEEEAIERSIVKSSPYGNGSWMDHMIRSFGLEQTLRKVGRPKER